MHHSQSITVITVIILILASELLAKSKIVNYILDWYWKIYKYITVIPYLGEIIIISGFYGSVELQSTIYS